MNKMSDLLSSDIYLQVPLYVHPRRPPASLAPWCSSPAEALGVLEAGGCPDPVSRCPVRQMCTERHPLGKQKQEILRAIHWLLGPERIGQTKLWLNLKKTWF